MQSWLAFSWPYNLLSDKVLRITVYSCTNAPAGPDVAGAREAAGRICERYGQLTHYRHRHCQLNELPRSKLRGSSLGGGRARWLGTFPAWKEQQQGERAKKQHAKDPGHIIIG